MRLKLDLECTPDVAWELVRSPAAFREAAAPVVVVRTREPGGFPECWGRGEFRVSLWLFGVVPIGEQTISLDFGQRRGARIMTDAGGPTSGALGRVRTWRHRMAVSPGGRSGTLYRDQLEFGAGPLGPLLWPAIWAFWQLRARGIRRLAKRAGER